MKSTDLKKKTLVSLKADNIEFSYYVFKRFFKLLILNLQISVYEYKAIDKEITCIALVSNNVMGFPNKTISRKIIEKKQSF